MRRRIIAGGDEPDHLIAGTVEAVVVAQVARPDDLDAGLAEPLLLELPGEHRRQRARKVDEGGVGLEIGDALQAGAKSGLASGTRSDSMISPPTWVKRVLNELSASVPGAQSLTRVTTRLEPFLIAHSASVQACGAMMKPARTK